MSEMNGTNETEFRLLSDVQVDFLDYLNYKLQEHLENINKINNIASRKLALEKEIVSIIKQMNDIIDGAG